MTHPTRAFSGSIINRFTGSKILARVGQISVAFPIVQTIFELQLLLSGKTQKSINILPEASKIGLWGLVHSA